MSEARFRFLSQEDVAAAGGLDVAATIDVHRHDAAIRLLAPELVRPHPRLWRNRIWT